MAVEQFAPRQFEMLAVCRAWTLFGSSHLPTIEPPPLDAHPCGWAMASSKLASTRKATSGAVGSDGEFKHKVCWTASVPVVPPWPRSLDGRR